MAGGALRQRWSHPWPRIRLAEAIPLRSDRRELRRRLQATACAARSERRRQITAGLSMLATRHERIVSVGQDVTESTLVEFADGTRVWLRVRDGAAALRRLARVARRDLYLGQVEACFGLCWYQLRVSTPEDAGSTILVKVQRFESGTRETR